MRSIPRLIRWILPLGLLFLVIMTILRFATWMMFGHGHTFSESIPAFWLGFRYDARIVCVFLLVILIFGSIPALNPFRSRGAKKGWLMYTAVFSTLFVFFYVLDFLHYRYLSQRLNASALSFLEDTSISARMVWQTYPVLSILIGIIVSVYILQKIASYLHKRLSGRAIKPARSTRTIAFIACLLVFALAIFGRAGQYPLRWSDAFNTGSDFNANISLNPFQSFLSSLSFRHSSFDRGQVKKYYPMLAAYLGVTNPNAAELNFTRVIARKDPSSTIRPNVVIVICESFSAYKSSMWGNPLNTTPFFNDLAGKGLFFDNCFTPHVGTARGVWASVTGIPDVEFVKTASRNPAMVDQHTIINDFSGYEKYYFLGGSTSWANIRGLLTNNIKNLRLFEEQDYDVPKIDVWGISDKNLFLQADKVLKTQTGPFIAVIQTADNHRPYTIPAEDKADFKKLELSADTLRKYGFESEDEFNAFRYTDYSFRKFMEAASKSPYFNNTIFAFVGDHGIHGNAGDMFPPAWTANGLDGYHVPLLFYAPGIIKPQRIHRLASQVDLLPTIAGLANIPYTNTTLGRDLMSNNVDEAALIVDHNDNNIGIIKDSLYYNRLRAGTRENIVWAEFNRQAPNTITDHDSLTARYRDITTAFFETARYMLLNNKKK